MTLFVNEKGNWFVKRGFPSDGIFVPTPNVFLKELLLNANLISCALY